MATKTNNENAIDWDSRKTWSPSDIASLTGYDPKSLRRVIRANVPADKHPGKGGSWALDPDSVRDILDRMGRIGSGRAVTITKNDLA